MGAKMLLPFVVGGVAAGLISAGMAWVAWRNRDVPAAPAFGSLMLAISGLCFSESAFLLSTDATAAYVLSRVSWLFSINIAPLFLVFVLAYAGYTRWLTPKWLAVLWAYPTVLTLAFLTAPRHPYAAGPDAVEMVTASGVSAPSVHSGATESIGLTLSYLTVALAVAVLLHFYRRSRTTHRSQTILIAIGAFVPLVASVAFTLGLTTHPGISPTPVAFTITGVAIGWALFEYDFLESTPVATHTLVEELPDPVFVLDEDDRVVDHNPAAIRAFDCDGVTGTHLSGVAPGLADHLANDEVYSLSEGDSAGRETVQFYDPQATAIEDQHGQTRGRLVVLREVTGQQRRQNRLEALQTATQQFITAGTDEEIARLAVNFVSRTLDQHAAAVYLLDQDEGLLRAAAATESVSESLDRADLVVDDRTSPIWRTYDEQTVTEVDAESVDWHGPDTRLLLLPIGDQGVLGIGSHDRAPFRREEQRFASILTQTMQATLSQAEYERQLIQSHASVERRSEQVEFFNGVLRHTLRNALLVIQGRADYLKAHVNGDRDRHLDVIERWCDDLAALNDEISAINDTVTASECDRMEALDLAPVLHDRTRTVEQRFDDVDVTLEVEDDLEVLANELAGKVVESVVLNAVVHNDSDDPRVEITAQRTADRVQVRVADNGPGMADELKEAVFERDVATSQTGNGFGLSFVSVLMNLYGGTVRFADNEPRGTIACLEFQAAD